MDQEHIHTLTMEPVTCRITCDGCDAPLRLATLDEATFLHMTDSVGDGGSMIFRNNVIVVPRDFSIWGA